MHWMLFLIQEHRTVLHFDLLLHVTTSTQSSGIGWRNIAQTAIRDVASFSRQWWQLQVEHQCVLCLVLSTYYMTFQGIYNWTQYPFLSLPNSCSLAWLVVCYSGVPYRWHTKPINWCKLSIMTNSSDKKWLFLECVATIILPMTTDGWSSVTACQHIDSEKVALTGCISCWDTSCTG